MAGRDFSAELFGPVEGRDFSAELFGTKSSKERTWTEAAKDVAAGVVSGAGSLVQLPGQLYGLATGDFSDTGALGLGKDISKFGEEMKSSGLKAREADRAEKIRKAEQTGQWEAFKTAFGETIKDPALLTSFLAEQAPQLLVPFGAAKVAKLGVAAKAATAAEGLTGAAAKEAVEEVTKAAATRATRAAIGAGAVQQGADVGSQAYEDIYKELISKGADPKDAADGAINLARAVGAGAAVISVLAQRLPGAKTLEESFAGVPGKGGRLLGGVKGALGEGASEIVEETGGKLAANIAMQQVKPEQSLLEGLGQTAGMAAVGGVGMGVVSGLARRPGVKEEAPPPAPVVTPPPAAVAETILEQLTPQQKQELERQRVLRERPKTTEELLAETDIQIGRPTTAEDVARIKDDYETAVIEDLLAQDAEMKRANEVAAKQREQQLQQTQLESSAEAIAGGISDIDRKVRENRIFSSVQNLIDRNLPFASTAINDINQKFSVINEAPLTEEERARIENIMGMVNTFTNFVNLPVLAPKPVDRFAENQAMEALIKERTERGQAEPLRAAPAAPSPRIKETPVSQGVGEGAALRPSSSVEPSVAQDRELITPAVAAPAAPTAPASEVLKLALDEQRAAGWNTEWPFIPADLINPDFRQLINDDPGISLEEKQQIFEAGKKLGVVPVTETVTVPPAVAAPAPVATTVPETPAFESKIVSRQPAPDGMEVHVFTTTDGYGTGLFDADAGKYVDGSITRFAGTDTLPKAEARAAEMVRKATPSEAPSPFMQRLQEYWTGTVTPAVKNYLDAFNSFGAERLEANQIKPVGMSPREWLESFVSKQSTWDKGRKTGETGIQALSTKNLWPTTDGSGERLRKSMLEAVKALKNAPGSTSELVDQAFGEGKPTAPVTSKTEATVSQVVAPVTPATKVEEETTPADEAKDIQEPTIRNKLKEIAKNLGIVVFETGGRYSAGDGIVNIPTEDKQVEGAQSPEHVFAHELGHAILQNRSMSFNGMPNAEVAKWIVGWDGIKAISKVFRPEIHNHKLPKFRRHANKPDEIIADALGSFLLGNSSKQDIAPLIRALNLNDFDLGIKAKVAAKVEPAAPKAEAPAAPPTLDTSGLKEVKGRHPQVQAAAKLLQDKKMTREEFEKYVDYYKPIQEVEAEKLLPPTSEQRMNETVNADKRDKINVPIADGTKVGLRMDLPARERGGSVVSIHEGKPGKLTVGKLMGFRSTGWLKDVTFEVRSQEKGLAVATGAAKAPQQTVEGTWQNLSPEETYARVKDLMKDSAWKQIGFDPSRHGYFYDRKTREPVVSASEIYQVGQFLLAKDVKYAPKTQFLYSLGKERTQQLQDFQQTLRSLLNRFGLKDVGLNIVEGLEDSGSYGQQLIRIAAGAVNPIRTLRHEAIHALRELGFFTPEQWKSLSKMAKDKWIDQYLKQRNIDGKPLKPGEESRYDAYMREYNGDMEKITEEAVADAFADFDAAKPPAGMLQSLLKRMKDLFQSIKSALTKVESPEQIFGKIEKGELKAGKKREGGERKSLGGTAGQRALDTINSIGMGVKPPEPGRIEKAKRILKEAGENPSLTKDTAKKSFQQFMDKVETMTFSADAAFNNEIRRNMIKDMGENPEILGLLLEASQSQTVHADALASQFMIDGGLEYNEELKKWQSVKKEDTFVALAKKVEELAKQYGVSKEEMERIAHTYFVAKRLPSILKRNEELETSIAEELAKDKPDRRKIKDLEDLKVFVSDDQLQMMQPGLSLVNTIPELKQVVDIWQGIRQNNIDVLVNSGLWSPEYAQAMWDNIDYVPYYREEQLEEGAGPQEFIRGLQVKSKEFQLKGSGSAVNDVFDNMIRWSQYAINRSVRAHKATQMIDAAKDIDVGDRKMAVKVNEEKRGMNIVRVFRDGKQELWDMADPLFVPAFSSIQNVSIPTLTFMSKLANVLRNSVVLYPLFSVTQVPQDSFAAMFSSGLKTQHALKIPFLAVKEFISTLTKTSQTHKELIKFGVVGVRDFSATVVREDAEIYAGLRPPKSGWGKIKEFLGHIAMAADNAVRQAVYEAALQQGLSKAEALEKAFEIINFRRRGTSQMLNVMGQTVPFFYAYLSAQRVAYKTLTGVGISPTQRKDALTTLATTTAAVMTLSMLYAMANGGDDDYADTPAAVRDRTLTIPGTGGVRIPLRPDFFLLPKIAAEHTYLLLTDKGYEDGAKFRKSMRDAVVNAVASPLPVPQALKPLVEVAINYDFFQGKPIVGQFEKQKDLGRQFNDSTSELSKLLGKTGFVSPILADHLIRGMLGSVGGLTLFATNQFLHSDPDVPRPEMSFAEMTAALPGTSGLLKRPQESALKNDFYTLREEVEKAVNTFNDIKTRSPQGIEDFINDEKQMAKYVLGKPVEKINRELAKIRKVITQVTNMPESQMSAAEKATFVRQMREVEREMLKGVNVKALREMAKI